MPTMGFSISLAIGGGGIMLAESAPLGHDLQISSLCSGRVLTQPRVQGVGVCRLRSLESNSKWPCGLGGSSLIRCKWSRLTGAPVGPRGCVWAAVTGRPQCGAVAG